MKDLFIKNRAKLYNYLNEGDLVVLYAGYAPRKRGDENYLFSPDRNFYYMTGLDREAFIFLFGKTSGKRIEKVFITPSNGKQAKWVGANLTSEEVKGVSAIEDVDYIESFAKVFEVQSACAKRLFLDWDRIDLQVDAQKEFFKQKYPYLEMKNIFYVIADFRTIKEEQEIKLIKKAIDITALGIEAMMKNAAPGMMEYEIEAYYDFVLKSKGVKDTAFTTIVAAGENGTMLHYVDNNSQAKDGDLILIDAGAQVGYYNGDLSRTFPVNGKFSEKQKLVYNIVLEGQKLIMDIMKPGYPVPMLNEALKDYYFVELKKIGLVHTREEVFKYYYHNVGHFLGAETHDVGDRSQNLKEGMVITVEPGLYIEEWGIGIRIEDDVLITEDGCRNLSENMIKTVEEIEAFMAKGK